MEEKTEKGCVYFFKHVGLSPVKIGFSTNESPCGRFEQFKTYAPYGAELVGFIRTHNAKELETELHLKFANVRLKGEWFDLSLEDVNKWVAFYSSLEDIEEENNFKVAWAKDIYLKNNPEPENKKKHFLIRKSIEQRIADLINTNPKLKQGEIAELLGVSRQTINRKLSKKR